MKSTELKIMKILKKEYEERMRKKLFSFVEILRKKIVESTQTPLIMSRRFCNITFDVGFII